MQGRRQHRALVWQLPFTYEGHLVQRNRCHREIPSEDIIHLAGQGDHRPTILLLRVSHWLLGCGLLFALAYRDWLKDASGV